MEWIDCNERLPDKTGDILVLINNKILVGEVVNMGWFGYADSDKVYFFIDFAYYCDDKNTLSMISKAMGGNWHKPQLYAEVTHWLELPKLPEKKAMVNNESN